MRCDRSTLAAGLARRARALAVLGALGMLTPLLARCGRWLPDWLAWSIDLSAHWQLLYATLLVLSVAGMAAIVRRIWLLVVLPLAAVPWLTVSAAAPGLQSPERAAPVLTVAEANVLVTNPNPALFLQWLSTERPDVIAVLEVSPRMAKALQNLPDYPYQEIVPREDAFGIALLSRHPFSNVKTRTLTFGMDYISARIRWQGREVTVTAVHPLPPMSMNYYRVRDKDLVRVASEANESKLPSLVIGDLNATPWSSALFEVEGAGFRRTTSLVPTWHTAFQGVTGIPIDHVLASPHWRVVEHHRGPQLGSDHYPILVKLALP